MITPRPTTWRNGVRLGMILVLLSMILGLQFMRPMLARHGAQGSRVMGRKVVSLILSEDLNSMEPMARTTWCSVHELHVPWEGRWSRSS